MKSSYLKPKEPHSLRPDISFPLAREGNTTHFQIGVTQSHARKSVILSSLSCKRNVPFVYCMHRSVRDRTTNKSPFSFSPFLVQFNSRLNLLSNYANEFIVGGSTLLAQQRLTLIRGGTESFFSSCLAVWEMEETKKGREGERTETYHLGIISSSRGVTIRSLTF